METSGIQGQLPYASHAYMTQHPVNKKYYVSDYDPKWNVLTRDRAIEMSQEMRHRCDVTVFYTDRGWSSGMRAALQYCKDNDLKYEERTLDVEAISRSFPICTKEFIIAIISDDEPYEHLLL